MAARLQCRLSGRSICVGRTVVSRAGVAVRTWRPDTGTLPSPGTERSAGGLSEHDLVVKKHAAEPEGSQHSYVFVDTATSLL